MPILQSHKNQVSYFEHSKIVKTDDKVAYTKDYKSKEFYFAIPYGNVAVILLGPGTSITQAAMHHLASEGVMVAFTGGAGFPIFCGSLSEYRPTKYCQEWLISWQNLAWRLETAKDFQRKRMELVQDFWPQLLKGYNIEPQLDKISDTFAMGLYKANSKEEILGYEANYAKSLYQLLSKAFEQEFKRKPGKKEDTVNELIDSHNYYAYAIAGTVLWVLGIPHSFPVLHGDTRRGALVFDLADIIKDAYLLPLAFLSVKNEIAKENHKKECIKTLNLEKTMAVLFNEVKVALEK